MLGPRRNVIVGDVSKKSYFASTTGALFEQTIAKYINSQGTRDRMPERKVYRFRVDPTAKQEAALARYAGARRFVFNWALQRRKETYQQTGKSISWSELSVELTGLKSKAGFE
jgi:Helix-turn-helix domain